MSAQAPEVREGMEMFDVGAQTVCEERMEGKVDREVTSELEETAFA